MWLYFNEDDYYRKREEWKKKRFCECGAWKTDNPNCHAEWCTMYKKDKFDTDSNRRKGNEDIEDFDFDVDAND